MVSLNNSEWCTTYLEYTIQSMYSTARTHNATPGVTLLTGRGARLGCVVCVIYLYNFACGREQHGTDSQLVCCKRQRHSCGRGPRRGGRSERGACALNTRSFLRFAFGCWTCTWSVEERARACTGGAGRAAASLHENMSRDTHITHTRHAASMVRPRSP